MKEPSLTVRQLIGLDGRSVSFHITTLNLKPNWSQMTEYTQTNRQVIKPRTESRLNRRDYLYFNESEENNI